MIYRRSLICTLYVKKIITKPENSVDGKKHTHTNYFKGIENYSFGDVITWDNNKQNAVKFTGKYGANKIAKRYNGFIKEI